MNERFVFNDGGRSQYFKSADVQDCVTMALAIAAQRDYMEVYNLIKEVSGKTPRNGVRKSVTRKVAEMLGGQWHPTMTFGSGCTTHLRAEELPAGRIVVQTSKHLVAVIDGVINDTFDPSRDGNRCVYGYLTF